MPVINLSYCTRVQCTYRDKDLSFREFWVLQTQAYTCLSISLTLLFVIFILTFHSAIKRSSKLVGFGLLIGGVGLLIAGISKLILRHPPALRQRNIRADVIRVCLIITLLSISSRLFLCWTPLLCLIQSLLSNTHTQLYVGHPRSKRID